MLANDVLTPDNRHMGRGLFTDVAKTLPWKQRWHFLTLLPLQCCFSVGQFCLKILALPGFGYFSVEHAQSFHDSAKMF